MANLGDAFKTFWHTMTSYDRHASHDSPYRTGQHVPLAQSRHEPMTGIAATAAESRADINSPYFEEGRRSMNGGGYPGSPLSSPNFPYSPGMRSSDALQRQNTNENFENVTPGEIQMQPFQEGLPPAPPPGNSWKRIDRWAEEHYPELFDQLCEGCTSNDLNELEHQLDCSLPMEVRESMQIHDGQERGGTPTGIIFSSMLLDCEEIVQEWEQWKKVNQEYLNQPITFKSAAPSKALGGSSSAAASNASPVQKGQNPYWREEFAARQDSQPPGAVQKVYAHPAWIPLVRDWGGNNLAVDLAPGPTGKWGQVILFGRDYDCKYVVARSWSAFLATVADDLSSGKWFVDEETHELKLREFKSEKVEPGYLDILRWRMDQKYGRKVNKRRSAAAPIKTGPGSHSGSPYASPTAETNGEPRGRSMQRFSGASPVASPNRPNYAKSSPLGKVTEELSTPMKVSTMEVPASKLVELDSPLPAQDKDLISKLKSATIDENVDNTTKPDEKAANGLGLTNGNATKQPTVEDDTMKTIEI